jgi:hypothetical protein
VRRALSHLPMILLVFLGTLLVVAFLARLVWGAELRQFEERMFDSLGVPPVVRYILIAVLVGFSWHRTFVSEKADAASRRRPVVRRSIVFALLAALAIALLILFAGM